MARAMRRGHRGSGGGGDSDDASDWIGTAGLLALWAGFCYYAFALAPDSVPVTDRSLIEGAIRLGVTSDGDKINQVFLGVFNLVGMWGFIYASLLLPTARSGNKVPAWPFVLASVFLGTFALLPYFALWRPPSESTLREDVYVPARTSRATKILESKIWTGLLAATTGYYSFLALSAGSSQWTAYIELFTKSKIAHVSGLDFIVLSLMPSFWVFQDAEVRKWDRGSTLLTVLALVPLYGPLTYLALRPKLSTAGEPNKAD